MNEGLTLWAFLYGGEYVSFKTLFDDQMVGYFVFSKAIKDGYLSCSVGITPTYRLTQKGMEVARES